MAFDEELAARVREQLAGRSAVIEKKMFGGLAFLVAGNMACGVSGTHLMVRLGPEAADAALDEPGVGPFDTTGRRMTGWVLVSPEALAGDALSRWVTRGATFAESLPAKQVATAHGTEILVSNGGGYVGRPARIPADRLRHLQRVCGVVDQGDYRGDYRSIRSSIADHGLPDALPFPAARARELAAIPTRLARLGGADIADLLRWGRVICDTAMGRWVLGPPTTRAAPGAASGAASGPP